MKAELKNKKHVIIPIICIVAVVIVVTIIMLILHWIKSSNAENGEKQNTDVQTNAVSTEQPDVQQEEPVTEHSEAETIRQSCKEFFEAYRKLEAEKAGTLLIGTGEPLQFGTLTTVLAQNISAEIGTVNADSETQATVEVTVSCIDVKAVLKNIPDNLSSIEEASTYLLEAFSAADVPKTSIKANVIMVKTDGQWKINMNDQLADALMGGYYSMLNEAAGEV